jgi:hypothetical protein
MLTVAMLQAQLALLDPCLPVAIGVVQQEGVAFELVASDLEYVDPCLTNDGAPCGVWLMGRCLPLLPSPELVTVQCACGTEVVVAVGDWMPEAHDACLPLEH